MTSRQIDDTATRIGDRVYLHLSPVGRCPRCFDPLTHDLDTRDLESFAVEVGHAAYKAAMRVLGERQNAEHDALNAEVQS